MRRRWAVAGAGLGVGWWFVRHHFSPAVRRWRRGAGSRHRLGALSVRTTTRDQAGPSTMLLHGIVGSGDAFGADFDRLAEGGRLVVPDLLGFGASMAPGTADFGMPAHLAALDEAAEALGVTDRAQPETSVRSPPHAPLTVVGHSMGGVLALHWAARRTGEGVAVRVVTICCPLYDTPEEADERIGALGPLARLIALDGPVARGVCAWMCDHRRLSAALAVALSPTLPMPIARGGVAHTWLAYSDAMDGLIRDSYWRRALRVLLDADVPVLFLEGGGDGVPVPGRAAALARRHASVTHVRHPRAGHDLPLADPAWCVAQITAAVPRPTA